MRTYRVTLNGKELFEGTLQECFKHLVGIIGSEKVADAYNAGYRIE